MQYILMTIRSVWFGDVQDTRTDQRYNSEHSQSHEPQMNTSRVRGPGNLGCLN